MEKENLSATADPDKKSGRLYLGRTVVGSRPRFSVRQSYVDDQEEFLRHRELVDLGCDPAQFLVYPSDNCFYVRDDLVEAVSGLVEGDASDLLEKIFEPYVREDILIKLGPSMARDTRAPRGAVTADEEVAIARELHIFDRRRLYYLWYGAIDQSRLFRMPSKLCRQLLGKSRDEKEQIFIAREQELYEDEVKEYLFAAFNLQHYFAESFARILPQALDQDKLDAYFVDELCHLNGDASFWQGMEAADGLQPYLIRYLILFFDYDFNEAAALNAYIRQFMDSRRQFHFPESKSAMSMEEASSIFGEPPEALAKLPKRELKKLFRKKAKELHPDTGGDHAQFVRLKEAFEELRRKH